MTHLLDQLVALVAGHGALVYGLIFLVTALEAAPVVGAFLPGAAALVGLSALIPTGAIALWPTLIAATLGAIVGDGWPFWLGHRYRERILQVWPLSRSPQLVSGSAALLRAHPIKSIVVARFTPARAVLPIAAGIAGMPARQFYVANVLSALAWAPAHVLPGALLGAAVSLLGAVAGRLALLAAVVAGTCWLLVFVVGRIARGAAPLLLSGQAALWRRVQVRSSGPARGLVALLDPAHPGSRSALFLALLLAAGASTGAAVLVDVAAVGQDGADGAVPTLFRGLRSSWGDVAMGDVSLVLAITGVVAAVLGPAWAVVRRAGRVAVLWLGCGALALLIAHLTGPALPASGGVATLGVLGQQCGALALVLGVFAAFFAGSLSQRAGTVLALSVTLAVALSALAGLYYGARLSDLTAGLALALLGIGAIGLAHLAGPSCLAGGGVVVTAAAMLAAGLGGGMTAFGPDYAGPAPPAPVPRLFQAQAWWDGEWVRLPARRIDLEDTPEEPLTLQWAGSAEDLSARLAPAGWHEPAPWTFRSALGWAEDAPAADALPVLPRLHRGLPPVLTLVRSDDSCPARTCALVLRLWRSRAVLAAESGPPQPVLVGTVVRQELRRPLPLLTVSVAQPDLVGPRDVVAQALGMGRTALRPGTPATPDWDSRVLIAPDPAGAALHNADAQ